MEGCPLTVEAPQSFGRQVDDAEPQKTSARTVAWRTIGVFAALGTLLLIPLPNDYRARWFGTATDLLHVPIFAALTWLLARFCWPRHLPTAIGLALAVAIGAELVQPIVGRSASWRDITLGVMGIGLTAAALQPRWPWACRAVVVAALGLTPLVYVSPVLIDAYRAWRTFPLLADFDAPFATRRWWLDGATLTPAGDIALVRYDANPEHGAAVVLFPVVRDWTGYERLEVEFSFEGEPLHLLISVRDGKRLPPELPRFDLHRRYPPGRHRVEIELADLARGGDFPPIELDRVQSLHLVAYDNAPRSIRLSPIRLSGKK